jgi:hypothetical protein
MAWPVSGLSYEYVRDGHPHNDQLPGESMNRIGRRTIYRRIKTIPAFALNAPES